MNERLQGYRERIERAFPDLVVREAALNDEGLVNDVVIVNGELVCRFARHGWGVDDLQQEARCLALAGRHVAMRVPQWTWHDDDFISYELIRGAPLQRYTILEADEATRQGLAEQVGTLLWQMHTIPMGEVEAQGIEPSVTNRTSEAWLEMYAAVQRDLFPHLMATAREWVHHHFAPLVQDASFMEGEQTFMHGDLATYHLLYDPGAGRLNGVLDFGTAGVGDPACDVACIISAYGERFLRYLDPYYPAIGGLIERARFWAGNLELAWLLGGLRDPDDVSWFAVHVGRARDALPIGSGWRP